MGLGRAWYTAGWSYAMDDKIDKITGAHGNRAFMKKLLSTRMPFGKYKGTLLLDLPEPYVVWFYRQGFPKGQLGEMLYTIYEIKVNGLEYLFRPKKT